MNAVAEPADLLLPPRPPVDDPLEQGRFTRWVSGDAGRRLGESTLQLGGMHCAACAGLIEQALASVDGVVDARVSAVAQRATVRWDPARTQPSALIDTIGKIKRVINPRLEVDGLLRTM
ncbi:MAG: heavy metal-associated domain-containing protein, partial [Rubrivivax sp.]|nr:heavy metal-associated domain-containing protein [Rubrivivax sp.]